MMNFSSFYSFSKDIECPNSPSPVMFSCFLNGQDPEPRESAFRSRDMYKKIKLAQHSQRWASPGSEPQRHCHRGSAEVSNEPSSVIPTIDSMPSPNVPHAIGIE